MTSVVEQRYALTLAILEARSDLSMMTGQVRRRCEEESEGVAGLLTALQEASGWDEIRGILRPYLRGDRDWPELPDYGDIETECDRRIRRNLHAIQRQADLLAGVTNEQGLEHTLTVLAQTS